MKNVRSFATIAWAGLIGVPLLASSAGCGGAQPEVICVMKNPATGQTVEMFREAWYKVPADYDEKKHLEQWKDEQRTQGFTLEVQK